MAKKSVVCQIEHHATLFALLAKQAILTYGEEGKEAILQALTRYGRERGARMAARALAAGEPLTARTFQAYGEWQPDFAGQMDFGRLQTEPTLQTYIAKCAWCEAWEKHGLLDFGRYYCLDIDNAVYQGFCADLTCTPLTPALSWGGERCEFDWGQPLTPSAVCELEQRKQELGTSAMKDFNFHTAHLLNSFSRSLREYLGGGAEAVIASALVDYVELFGQEYLEALDGEYDEDK